MEEFEESVGYLHVLIEEDSKKAVYMVSWPLNNFLDPKDKEDSKS